MLEAITGVPAAKASVRIIPKLSPESEGAQRTSAACRRRQSSSWSTRPGASTNRSVSGVAEVAQDVVAASAPTTVSRAGNVLDQRLEGLEQHGQALALLRAADEHDLELVVDRASGRTGGPSESTPLGMIVYSPPNQRLPVQAAASETAMRACSWLKRRLAPPMTRALFGIIFVA